MSEWVSKMWAAQQGTLLPVLSKKDLHTWMSLRNTTLSQGSRTEITWCRTRGIWNSRDQPDLRWQEQISEPRVGVGVTGGGAREPLEVMKMSYPDCGPVHRGIYICLNSSNYTLKNVCILLCVKYASRKLVFSKVQNKALHCTLNSNHYPALQRPPWNPRFNTSPPSWENFSGSPAHTQRNPSLSAVQGVPRSDPLHSFQYTFISAAP